MEGFPASMKLSNGKQQKKKKKKKTCFFLLSCFAAIFGFVYIKCQYNAM